LAVSDKKLYESIAHKARCLSWFMICDRFYVTFYFQELIQAFKKFLLIKWRAWNELVTAFISIIFHMECGILWFIWLKAPEVREVCFAITRSEKHTEVSDNVNNAWLGLFW